MLATSPNIVLVMTDDQRLDTMFAMPITQQLIGGTGTTFENAYTVTSFCCPSRSSMLTGQYVHNHGTVGNDEPQGGFEGFDDSSTLATWLQDAGYRTGLYGKYLNGYYETSPRNADPNNMYVPPGWDEWHAFLGSSFYNFDISANGVYTQYPGANYSTDVLADLASDFIETGETNDDQPFFLFYSVKAPHTPANPAQRHNSVFDDIEPYRPPSFNEGDVSDKPAYVRNQASLTAEDIATIDQFRENQLESLLAVDEAVGQLVETLQANGEWDNTIFIFMSDSGIQWGEHRWDVKGTAYEETIRIPMIIRDGRDPVQRTSDPYALTIDIAPTLLEYAGISVPDHIDGESLVPLITGQDPTWRNDFIVEHLNIGSQPTSIALRSGDWSYNEYSTGERELYNLATDPYQMQSLHNDPAYASIMSQLSVRLHELKSQDTQAPQITNVTVTPNITNEGAITIKATVSDVNTGGSEVRMPTFHIDQLGGIPQGFAMYPDDGLFDSVTENVTAVISPEAFAALSVGTHTIYLRGRDTAANWSTAVTATFTKTAEAPTQSYVSASPLSISGFEGNSEFVIYEFIVSRTGVTTGTSAVDYAVVGVGSSPADAQDFGGSFPVGTVTFAPGETTQVVSISVSGDTNPELDETFQVVFSNPSVNTNLQTTSVGGIILNDETLASTQGLRGEYFNDVALTEFVSTRTDSTVNFTSGWNGGPPGTGVTADQTYSVRWSGEVDIAAGGAWTFYTTTNDGVRLWIDDQMVIDDWNSHIALENAATINLSAGWHRIRMEYFQQGGGAVATLSFAGPGQTKAIIPQSRLRTASIAEPVAPVLAIAAASASKAEGNADFTPYTFTVSRTENTADALSVDYQVTSSGGDAADAADFGGSFPSGTLVFAPGEMSKTITILVSGDTVPEGDETFAVVLLNASGDAEVSTDSATGTIVNDDASTAPTQSGLQGEYFNSINLTNLATTRVDQAINFTTGWNSTPPGTTVTGDANYSVRWTGEVEVAASGSWTFFTTSNDGIRLWIDDQMVIDNWTQHVATENSGTVNLTAGWHSIRLEYFQQGGAAVATLSFQGPDQAKAIIPQDRLRTPLLPVALTHTMVVGGVTDTAAKVWFRTESEAQVVIEYSTSPDFTTSQQSSLLVTQLASDFTGIVTLAGLSPETKYYYRAVVNGVVPAGTAAQSFTTFAPAGAVREFSFAIFADFENAGTFPTVAAPAYEAAAEDNPAFVLNIGDFDHRNPQSLTQLRNMHRQMRGTTAAGVDFAENIASSYPFFYVWDDHDFGTDDADKNWAGKDAALQAYNEYFPSADRSNSDGVWQELSYGQVDVFMLDVRSQADPRLEADGPDKSMLDGDNIENGQLDWLKQGLLNSTATWKILTSGVSFNPTTKPYDAWGAYGREREELLDFIDTNGITGVVIISGDLHTGGAVDNGTNSTLPELSVPHTNLPTDQAASGLLGTWTSVTPGSAGGGYGWVTISPEGLTLEARDADGNVRQQLLVPTPTAPSATLSVEATSANKSEGNSDLTPYTFAVTRSAAASEATTVDYVVMGSGINAANAADFAGTLPTGTLTFEAGETAKVITILVSGDTTFEADESFTVTLQNASGDATITGATATGVILNDDATAPTTEPGLKGEYFNSTDLTNLATTRVDQAINFTTGWNSTPPGTTVTGDANYSVRWTGQVETPTEGEWTFFTTSNDGIRLWIDDQLIIDNWTTHIATENSGTVNLTAGWHSIRLEYFQQGGAAVATLSFQGPDQSKVLVPTGHLRTGTDTSPPTPAGDGLEGQYYNSTDLTGLVSTRVDSTVNFTTGWNASPLGSGVAADAQYSVRWTGYVETSSAGDWTFFTTSNDGVRLWINDQLIIDNWTTHVATENSGTVNLPAGWHSIRLEYFQQGGAAIITLSYQGPGQTKTIIPQSRLNSTLPGAPMVLQVLNYTGEEQIDQPYVAQALSEQNSSTPFDPLLLKASADAALLAELRKARTSRRDAFRLIEPVQAFDAVFAELGEDIFGPLWID